MMGGIALCLPFNCLPNCSNAAKSQDRLGGLRRSVESHVGKIRGSARYHRAPRKLSDDYIVSSDVLGAGLNGEVMMATSRRHQGQRFAVKTFSLDRIGEKTLGQIRTEVENHLSLDHPHIVRLVDVYESSHSLHMVTECMEGGELFDRLADKKTFAEDDAKNVVHQVLLALNYMHRHGIAHRDVKLENCVYEEKGGNHLKLIDFGFSQRWGPDCSEKMKQCLGTMAYVAPEVLAKSYTSQCDLWSLGVVCYMLLSGKMPFYGTEAAQRSAILAGRYSMKSEAWGSVSSDAKAFVASLLQTDPCKRLTAQQALEHPWMSAMRVEPSTEHAGVVESLQQFSRVSAFSRDCMQLLVLSLPREALAKMRDAFLAFDFSGQGAISFQDLKRVMVDETRLADQSVAFRVFEALDYSRNQEIHYSDFLAAMVGTQIELDDILIASAFRRLDVDNNGCLTKATLRNVFGLVDDETVADLINDTSQGNDGCVPFEQFADFLKRSVHLHNIEVPQSIRWLGVFGSFGSYLRK